MENWIVVSSDKHSLNVSVIAEIRNNETGEVVEYETVENMDMGDTHPSTFNWSDNNFSCDCNRNLFFKRAKGVPETEEDWTSSCTNGKYSVNLKNKKDCKLYYKEF